MSTRLILRLSTSLNGSQGTNRSRPPSQTYHRGRSTGPSKIRVRRLERLVGVGRPLASPKYLPPQEWGRRDVGEEKVSRFSLCFLGNPKGPGDLGSIHYGVKRHRPTTTLSQNRNPLTPGPYPFLNEIQCVLYSLLRLSSLRI